RFARKAGRNRCGGAGTLGASRVDRLLGTCCIGGFPGACRPSGPRSATPGAPVPGEAATRPVTARALPPVGCRTTAGTAALGRVATWPGSRTVFPTGELAAAARVGSARGTCGGGSGGRAVRIGSWPTVPYALVAEHLVTEHLVAEQAAIHQRGTEQSAQPVADAPSGQELPEVPALQLTDHVPGRAEI